MTGTVFDSAGDDVTQFPSSTGRDCCAGDGIVSNYRRGERRLFNAFYVGQPPMKTSRSTRDMGMCRMLACESIVWGVARWTGAQARRRRWRGWVHKRDGHGAEQRHSEQPEQREENNSKTISLTRRQRTRNDRGKTAANKTQ
jgi:hypothetical protein